MRYWKNFQSKTQKHSDKDRGREKGRRAKKWDKNAVIEMGPEAD